MLDPSDLRNLPDDQLKSKLAATWKANRAQNGEGGEATSPSDDEVLAAKLLGAYKHHASGGTPGGTNPSQDDEKPQGTNPSQGDDLEVKLAEIRRVLAGLASSSTRPRGPGRRRDYAHAMREKEYSSDEPDDEELEDQIFRDLKALYRQIEKKAQRSSTEIAMLPLIKLVAGLARITRSSDDISPENDGPGPGLASKILDGFKRFCGKRRGSCTHPDNIVALASRMVASMERFMSQMKAGHLPSDFEATKPPKKKNPLAKKNPLDRLKGRQATKKKEETDSTQSPSDGPDEDAKSQLPQTNAAHDLPPSAEGHCYGMVKETTAWDVYNNEAKKMDNELVKDWRESLNSLLLFTAIFAAVLAAFIIEAYKMLSQDPTDLLASITLWSLNNHGNVTNLPYIPAPFQASWTAVSINSLLFASLGVTLIASLASVVALQWVADYDAAITRGGSSPEDQAKRRQFRFVGVVDWKMGEIIAALPLLLYTSVALFWAGAIQWMCSIHYIVGYVVVGNTAIAAFFYVITTFFGTAFVTTPFRTPLSRGLYWLLRPSTTLACHILSCVGCKTRAKWIALTGSRLSGLRGSLTYLDIKLPSLPSKLSKWVSDYLVPNTTSRRREDKAAGANPRLRQESLDWLARHLPVSTDSRGRLLLLITEFLTLSPEPAISSASSVSLPLDDAWLKIFNFLGWHYMRLILSNKIEKKSCGEVGVLLRCFTAPQIRDQIKPSPAYERDPAKPKYWSQCCITEAELAKTDCTASENVAFLLARDIPVPLTDSKQELAATMKLIKWRNSTDVKDIRIWKEIFSNIALYSPAYIQACLKCFKLRLFAADSLEPSEELVQTIEAFEKLMTLDDDPKFHLAMVQLLSEYAEDALQQPRKTLDHPASLSHRLNQLQDPCFAILGGYAYDVPVAVGVTMTKAYMKKYFRSFKPVQTLLLHKKLRKDDSPALWQLRAAIAGTSPEAITNMCFRAAREMDQLTYIESLFQYPLHCTGHATGQQHLLYHFNCDNASGFAIQKGQTLYGLDLGETRAHPALIYLVFPGPDYASLITQDYNVNLDCVEKMREVCEDVIKDPAALIALVTDIAFEHLRYECKPQWAALLLKLAETIISLPRKDEAMHLLRPMIRNIGRIRQQMMGHEKCPKEEIDSMAQHIDRVCAQLNTISATRVVCSTSHTRMLSCAQAYRSPRAAIGWLPMYDGMSKDELRMGVSN